MTRGTRTRIKNGLIQVAYQSRLSKIWPSRFGGCGAILALHRVRPEQPEAFAPNRTLEITPRFLDQTIRKVRDLGLEIISLDEMHQRLTTGETKGRFVCCTLDDGYIDNFEHASPVFEAHQVPFSIYVTTGLLDRTALFWWLLLEEAIRRYSRVTLTFEGDVVERPTATVDEKHRAFSEFHRRFRASSGKDCLATAVELTDRYQIDPEALCAEQGMTWTMAQEITDRGMGTIEAHGVSHLALSQLTANELQMDIEQSCTRVEEETGHRPRHFAYPFGDSMAADQREFDLLETTPLLTATTTKKGMLWPEHSSKLMSLPRLTLNGLYQPPGYVEVLLSGLGAFA